MPHWKATLKDGSEVSENDSKWSDVKNDIQTLSMALDDGRKIVLPAAESYVQAKSASANIGSPEITVESRYIGWKLGNNTIIVRVNEKTQDISVEVN